MGRPVIVPGWLLLALGLVIAANVIATAATGVTVRLMHAVTPFALAVRDHDERLLPLWRCAAYPALVAVILVYLWPLIAYFRCGRAAEPSEAVRRRAVNGPFVM